MKLNELCDWLWGVFADYTCEDYSNNGLQVEGAAEVKRIAFAVDACLETFTKAAEQGADMLFVHHNTVLFRIRHIRKMLSLDPLHRDSGLATLSLLYHYCRLKPMIQPGYAKARAEGE